MEPESTLLRHVSRGNIQPGRGADEHETSHLRSGSRTDAHHHYARGGSGRPIAVPPGPLMAPLKVRTDFLKVSPSHSHSFKRLSSSASVLFLPAVPPESSGTRSTCPSKEETKLVAGSPFQTQITPPRGDGRRRLLETNEERTGTGNEATHGCTRD